MEFVELNCYNQLEVMLMIIKHRYRPVKIAGYEALLKRLPVNHVKRRVVVDKLDSANAGAGGEERIDTVLSYFEPDYPFLIIQDLSLPERSQIDTLLILQDRIIILEVKNLSGELQHRTNPSALHQTMPNGYRRFLKSPVIQIEVAKIKLQKVLKTIECQVPIETVVVMAYPSQFIEDVPPGAKVWVSEEVLVQLYRIDINNKLLSVEQMHALANKLLSINQQYQPFPLAPKLNINLQDIETGVFCPHCKLRKMKRIVRRWECDFCDIYSLDAHLDALDEWFMLYKSTITTKECQDFLGLPSNQSAQRALKRKNLKEVGGKRYRYFIEDKTSRTSLETSETMIEIAETMIEPSTNDDRTTNKQ